MLEHRNRPGDKEFPIGGNFPATPNLDSKAGLKYTGVMKNLTLALITAGALVFLAIKCAPSRTQPIAFTGEWTVTQESETAGTRSAEEITIRTDGKRFRTEAKVREERFMAAPAEHQTVRVFDGETLHEKTIYPATPEGFSMEPSAHSHKPSEEELHNLRFWAKAYSGDAGAGEPVAGRKTKLYQARMQLPDSDRSVRAWVDEDTGVVLKSEITLHSRQANTTVLKISEESRAFSPGPVDDSLFQKP